MVRVYGPELIVGVYLSCNGGLNDPGIGTFLQPYEGRFDREPADSAGQKPRILLILLAVWSLLAVVTQLFVNSALFLDIHGASLTAPREASR